MLIISLNRSLVCPFVVLLFHMHVSLTHSLVCRSFFFLALRFLHRSVVISKLTPGQVAAKTGKLKIGQIVVKVCVVLRVHSSLDLVVSKEVCVLRCGWLFRSTIQRASVETRALTTHALM
jgi:hypothetical protein